MCIGVPMEILSVKEGLADCISEAENRREQVDLSLVGDLAVGSWVLVFMGSAREVIDPDELDNLLQARQAMKVAMEGGNVDAYFADIIEREPQLPDFLQPKN